jgi:hypothetical protein
MAMADDGFGNLGTWATEPFIASRVTSGFDDANNPRGSVAANASDALALCAHVRLDTFECYMRTLVRRAAVQGMDAPVVDGKVAVRLSARRRNNVNT